MRFVKLKTSVFFISILIFLIACSSVSSKVVENRMDANGWKTNYTFVFVHGLSGWGHYDAVNKFFPYWGMKNGSLINQLNKEGFNTVDASVAPQGSAWDRACELYAQLTGTVTDYGKEHSERCGHKRYGRDFSRNPLIKNWDDNNKINLLGHSFGGVTVRLLAHLMAEGSEIERNITDEGDISPLFTGGKADWIYSVTALAAPHNGTSAYHVPDFNPKPKSRMQKLMDKTNAPKKDGRLDIDYADYDMHIQNAKEINKNLTTLKNVYYFSYSCSATETDEEGMQSPVTEIMEDLFERTSSRMGHFEGTTPDGIKLGKEWQENDGLVNTVSAFAPDFALQEKYLPEYEISSHIKTGLWYIMPVYKGDHMSLQGGLTIRNDIKDFYLEHLNRINKL